MFPAPAENPKVNPPDSSTDYRPDIDGLRAVAILSVLGYHATSKFKGGFVGVDIFFVISGYLISRLLLRDIERQRFSIRRFYARRIRRILPALVMVLAAVWLAGWLFLFPRENRSLGRNIVGATTFLSNILFWADSKPEAQGYFEVTADVNPLLHLWSLGVEEQFYIIFPWLLFLAVTRKLLRPRPLRFFCFLAISSFAVSLFAAYFAPTAAFFSPISRFWELLVGTLLAISTNGNLFSKKEVRDGAKGSRAPFDNSKKRLSTDTLAVCGILIVVGSVFVLRPGRGFPGFWALLPTSGAALLILSGPNAWINRVLLSHPVAVWIGLISYPLYLWHWPILSYAYLLVPHDLFLPTEVRIICVGLSVVLAWLTYRFWETPMRYGRLPSASAIRMLVGCLVGMLCIAALSFCGLIHARSDHGPIEEFEQAVSECTNPKPGVDNYMRADDFRTVSKHGRLPETTLFIGDSHIDQYWPRIEKLLNDTNLISRSVIFATAGGCPPIPSVNRTTSGFHCDAFFDFAMGLAQSSNVTTVVLSADWEAYFSGNWGCPIRSSLYVKGDIQKSVLALDSVAAEHVFEELAARLYLLRTAGKKVFLILSSPSAAEFDPRRALTRERRIYGDKALPEMYVDQRDLDTWLAPVCHRLKKVADDSGATIIDPRPYLLEGHSYSGIDPDGTPRYKDTNHMRPAYVREHAVFIDQVVLLE